MWLESIQKVLLAEQELTLDSALDTALSMEAAAKKTKEMKVLDNSGQATGTVRALLARFPSFVHVVAMESIVVTSASSSMLHVTPVGMLVTFPQSVGLR